MWFRIPSPVLPCCFPIVGGVALEDSSLAGEAHYDFSCYRGVQCDLILLIKQQHAACSYQKRSDDVFATEFKVKDLVPWEGNPCQGLRRGSTCSVARRSEGFAALAISCAGCWLAARAGLLFQAAGLCLRGTVLAGENAVQGSLSSPNPRAVLASLRQLRVYGFGVCDVMRVLAFRNFTTEEAVWNAGRILETFEYALGFFLVSSEQRYRWIRPHEFF